MFICLSSMRLNSGRFQKNTISSKGRERSWRRARVHRGKKGRIRGSHGEQGRDFSLSRLSLEDVFDPTGAGDTFAGGFMGYLSNVGERPWRRKAGHYHGLPHGLLQRGGLQHQPYQSPEVRRNQRALQILQRVHGFWGHSNPGVGRRSRASSATKHKPNSPYLNEHGVGHSPQTRSFAPTAHTNLHSKIERGDKEEATEAYILVRRGADDEVNKVI